MTLTEKILVMLIYIGLTLCISSYLFNQLDPWVGILFVMSAVAVFIRFIKWLFISKNKDKQTKKY